MTQDILMSNDEPVATTDASRNQLNQYCATAKVAEGAPLLEVVRQVLEAPSIYVFGELLALPNVQELKDGPNAKYLNTLNLFAYGTFKQYKQQPGKYLELTATMQKKLQHLTIVSLAIKNKCIPYEVLLEELEINNVRHLEDVIIEAIYAASYYLCCLAAAYNKTDTKMVYKVLWNLLQREVTTFANSCCKSLKQRISSATSEKDIIHGKLFQNNRFLEIDYAQGRDIPPGYTTKIAHTLQQWVDSCNTISNCIDVQITRANIEKAKSLKNKEHIDTEIINLKKVLKTQITDNDESMQVDARESSTMDIRRKPFKTKSSRLHHAPLGKLSGMASSSTADAGGNVVSGNAAGGSGSATSVTVAAANTTTSWLKSFTQSFDKE